MFPKPPTWCVKVYAVSFAGILALSFLLAVSLVITGLAAFSSWISDSAGEGILLAIVNFAVSLAVLTILFSMLFKWCPDKEMAWTDVWLGGFITALLFNAGKSAIAWYIGTQGLDSTYGACAVAGDLVMLDRLSGG
jgi:membrane protein